MAESLEFLKLLNAAALWINVALLLGLVLASVARHRRESDAWQFLVRSGIALLVTFVLAHFNRWWHLWKHHEEFPSGHVTFFLCVATSIVLLYRRSWIFLLPSALAYSWLIVEVLRMHIWLDAAGSWVMAPPVTWLCHNWRRTGKSAPPAA